MGYHIDTRCVRGEGSGENHLGAVSVPIYQTATFAHPCVGESSGYDYTRESNPTRTKLEELVSSLEGAADTLACTSGMAAITLCLDLFDPGDHIICTEDLYGGSVRLFDDAEKKRGLVFTYIDTSSANAIRAALTPATKALYIETPSNPTMIVTDIRECAAIARENGLLLIVDNTFLSPYFQNPIALGADIVIHSGTKYLSGHNDTIAGFISSADAATAGKLRFVYKTTGSCLSAFDSFLVIRGIKTLGVRMEKQQENALKIADALKAHKKIKKVYYVGLPDHPGYEINRSQASGSGAMISFKTQNAAAAVSFINNLKLITYAESLGGVESLVTYPMLQTHGDVPADVRERLGITDDFVRLSVGIENADDLIADIYAALDAQ